MNQNCSYCTPINSLFADDSLFLFKPEGRYPEFGWDKKNTLAWLCRIYGQVVNFCKSNVFFSSNMHDNEQRNLASILWVNLASCPWNISRNETRFVICP